MTALPLVQCCAPLAAPALSDDEATELETVFKALADRHRVRILNRLLAAGGEAVCVIRLLLRHEPPCTASTRHLDRAMPGRNLFRPGSKPSDAAGNDESPGSRGFLRSG